MIEYFATFEQRDVHKITITSDDMQAEILTYGGILSGLYLKPYPHSLVLGFKDLSGYLRHQSLYMGAILGRVANRIAHAEMLFNDRIYPLSCNWKTHTLHGGQRSFSNQIWEIVDVQRSSVTLGLQVADGDQGFPGRLQIHVTYEIVDTQLYFYAKSDAIDDSIANVSQHAYFNLSSRPNIVGHLLEINATQRLQVDADLIPTGTYEPLAQSVLDFSTAKELSLTDHIDHYFYLDAKPSLIVSQEQETATYKSFHCRIQQASARFYSPESHIMMQVFTTEPGLQVYSAAGIQCHQIGVHQHRYESHAGLAIETQLPPDAIHHPQFPSIILKRGQSRIQATCFDFSVCKDL